MLLRVPRHTPSSSFIPHLVRHSLLLLLTLSLAAAAPAAQDNGDTAALQPGKPVKGELAEGQTHSYRIELASDQYLHVIVEQRGADVMLATFGPNGKQIAEINNSKGTQGLEHLFLITVVGGSYRLEVRPSGKGTPAGGYEVRVEELRAATEQDKYRMAANLAFAQAEVLRALGTAESLRKSVEKYKDSISLWQAVRDSRNEAATLLLLGKVYDDLGEKQQALDTYAKALPYWRGAKDGRGLAAVLGFIGKVYDGLGRKQEALDKYEEAWPLWRAVPNIRGEAALLNNIGKVYSDLGEKQTALDKYKEAQALWRAAGDNRGLAASLNNIGGIYRSLGLPQKALENYKEALSLWRTFKDSRGEATLLNNIGKVYDDLGEKQQALKNYKDALALSSTVGDLAGQALALNNIGGLHDEAGEKKEALANYQEALALWQSLRDPQHEAAVRNNIGKVYYDLGDKQATMDSYTEALALWRKAGDRGGQATTLANIAFTERSRGNHVEARAHIEEALSIVESLRTKIGSQDLRSSYFATVQAYYEFYIDLLMQMHKQQPSAGHDGEALRAAERARARSLLELLAEARVDIRQGVDPKLVERERSLQHQLNARAQRQVDLRGEQYSAEQAKGIAKEVEDLLADLQQAKTQIRQANPRYASLTQPVPLALHEIQKQVLDADTLLLEYSLGSERSYLWAVTPISITSYELPRRTEIETAAKDYSELLASPNVANESDEQSRARLTSGRRLSRMLLGPIASQLNRKRLVIVADGALQYLPFAALPDPASIEQDLNRQPPLIVRHQIVSLPSISIMPTLRNEVATRSHAPQTLAVLADPVFSSGDKRVKRSFAQQNSIKENNFERLIGSRKEARRILALVPSSKAMSAFDFDASRALAGSDKLSSYRYVLFATHGRLDHLHPELSSIVFSLVDKDGNPQNGYLRLNEIYNLNLPADAVTLSGCETGLGKEIRGEGLVGLTRGFMYAGAARVIVSLWRADDEATAELMIRFYRGILKEGKQPAEALRASQVEMIRQTRWRSPHYWGAFVLQGEWR
jgi:CHAT domain-containing protein/Tfp pilus assembly protein PilF